MPSIRASQLHSNLAGLAQLGPELERQILKHLNAADRQAIVDAPRAGWLPLEFDVQLTDAVVEVGGLDTMMKWSNATMMQSFSGPLLRPVIDGAVRVFGLNPGSLLRLAPRVWHHVFRDCGELHLTGSFPGFAGLHLVDAAPELTRSSNYLKGIASSLEALFTVCQREGTIRLLPVEQSLVVFECRWD